MTVAELQALVQQHGSIGAAARALGMARSTLRDRLNGRPTRVRVATVVRAAAPVRVQRAHTFDDFRAQFDRETVIPAKISAALRELGNGWLYETEFAQLAGVGLNDLGRFRDAFADHHLEARAPGRSARRVWVGSVEIAAQMRAMV